MAGRTAKGDPVEVYLAGQRDSALDTARRLLADGPHGLEDRLTIEEQLARAEVAARRLETLVRLVRA